MKSSEEISQKKIEMSESAINELEVLGKAVNEIMDITVRAYKEMDISEASKIEPLEQVIDMLVESIRQNHVARLQKGYCTIEKGFILADILNNYERISDHCSNIAVAVIEADSDIYDPHEYLKKVRVEEKSVFNSFLEEYEQKYNIKKLQ